MKTIIIGRDESCDIVVNNPVVSRKHAMLRIYPLGRMELIDMSQNGVKINGTKIKKGIPCPVSRSNSISIAEVYQLEWSMVPNPGLYVKLALFVLVALLFSGLGWYYYNYNTSTSEVSEQINGQSYEVPQGDNVVQEEGKTEVQTPEDSKENTDQSSVSLEEKESESSWVDGFINKEKEKSEKKKKQKSPSKSDSNKSEKKKEKNDSETKTVPEIII
jgi:hypothetical protein